MPWHKRIHPDIEIEEVDSTLKMIEELYRSIDTNKAEATTTGGEIVPPVSK